MDMMSQKVSDLQKVTGIIFFLLMVVPLFTLQVSALVGNYIIPEAPLVGAAGVAAAIPLAFYAFARQRTRASYACFLFSITFAAAAFGGVKFVPNIALTEGALFYLLCIGFAVRHLVLVYRIHKKFSASRRRPHDARRDQHRRSEQAFRASSGRR